MPHHIIERATGRWRYRRNKLRQHQLEGERAG